MSDIIRILQKWIEAPKLAYTYLIRYLFEKNSWTPKKFKMAAKNPRWPPEKLIFLIIFQTINIFEQHKEAINSRRSFYLLGCNFGASIHL